MRITSLAAALIAGTALATPAAAQPAFTPVTDATLANPDPADWLMVSRTYDEQRFSPLTQINKANVKDLRLAWARGLPPASRG